MNPLLRVKFVANDRKPPGTIITGLVVAWTSPAATGESAKAIILIDDSKRIVQVPIYDLTGIGIRREIDIS